MVGRYWKMGFFNDWPFYVQELRTEGSKVLMLFATRGNWWIVEPGFGETATTYLVQSDWPDRAKTAGDANQPLPSFLNLGNLMWKVPYSTGHCDAVCCVQGQIWLHDYTTAQTSSQLASMHQVLDSKALEADNVDTGAATGSADDPNQAQPEAFGEEEEPEAFGVEEEAEEWVNRPKAGSLNHKCALIVAYERQDWDRMEHLIKVLLAFEY
jgi:hypothetical protein